MATQPKDILTTESLQNQGQIPLPNATASLVLGILSLVFCVAYGVLGVVLGGIGFYLAQKDKKLLDLNPEAYTPESISSLNAGKVCSLIGLILGGLFILIIVVVVLIVGVSLLN